MAIRFSCGTALQEAAFPGEYVEAANSPKVLAICRVSLRGKRIAAPVCALVRNDMQKERRVRGCKYVPPLSLRGAKRRGNPLLLRQGMAKSSA